MSREVALANALLVLPDGIRRGSVLMREGRIASVDQGGSVPPGAIDCDGDLVAPGLVELHTDNLERHLEPRPGVQWPRHAAVLAHDGELASVGITTVFDAVRVGTVVTDERISYPSHSRAVVDELLSMRASGLLRISHFLHLRAEICSETLIDDLNAFDVEDRVGIVSLMDHTPGQRQFRDTGKLREYYSKGRGFSEAEFVELVAQQIELQSRVGARHEAAAVAAAGRFGAILASHDDTTAEHVAVSVGHGVRLAEFPTTSEAARASHEAGIAVMMGAPNLIRGGSHSGNVAARDLAQAGHLDILSSDYVPGALLSAALHLGDIHGDRAAGLRAASETPAKAAGLTDRGRILEGLRADLIRVHAGADFAALRGVWVQGRQVG
ncbi:MAG: alpha-D-ribose 1-methylphosphonate 5-triphosphate diphosphatase [Pseudomonadota bacterium]